MTNQTETIEVSDWKRLPTDPLVSVCVLAYRHEKFIAQTIEGVIAQRCDFPIELILGEDCSPDRTRAIALDYQQRYPHLIRILTAKKNVGGRANWHRCQSAIRGKYVAICEGDDYWHDPRKLQMQMELMSSNPDMVCCHTDFDRMTRFRTRRDVHKSHPSRWLAQGEAYIALLHEWSVMTATSIYCRDVIERFEKSEFANPQWPFGDRNLLLYASTLGKFGYIPVSTTVFRKVRGSAMNQSFLSRMHMELATEECIELFLAKHPVNPTTANEARGIIKSKLYDSAFYLERADLMQATHDWLIDHGFGQNEPLHRLRLAAIASKFPIRAIRATRNFVNWHLSATPS